MVVGRAFGGLDAPCGRVARRLTVSEASPARRDSRIGKTKQVLVPKATSTRTNSFASIPAETAVRGGCPARAKHSCPYPQKRPDKPTRYRVATRHRPQPFSYRRFRTVRAVSHHHTLCAQRAAPRATLPHPRPPLRSHLGAVERRLPVDQILRRVVWGIGETGVLRWPYRVQGVPGG